MICAHDKLSFELSSHADRINYARPTPHQLAAATVVSTARGKYASFENSVPLSTFPAPLVLPGDALSIDPRCPPQSFRSWLRLKERNEVTLDKNVIYVVAPPEIGSDVNFMRSWAVPKAGDKPTDITAPDLEDIKDYLTAFYHGIPVRTLPAPRLRFATWEATSGTKKLKSKPQAKIPSYIGLNTRTECVRIRTRPSSDGTFAAQLNLDDLLDAAISILPDDAYALLLLVNQDLYEDDDDEFVCGRAYGGSRVAVISTARYNPNLDQQANVERVHAWPASHCEKYVHDCCKESDSRPSKKAKVQKTSFDSPSSLPQTSLSTISDANSPMQEALSASKALPPIDSSSSSATLSGLWLGRLCRTASHELGHCFGMEHCVYYACVMQSSASLPEDARQPPYLCPVDLAKTLHATGSTAEARYKALLAYCDKHLDVHLFAAYAAWIRARLADVV